MRPTAWIKEQWKNLRSKRAAETRSRKDAELHLYLRRMEDRRVLSVTGIEDAYFVDEFASSLFVSDQPGLLTNDIDSGGQPLFVQNGGTIGTAQGGTVLLNTDGSFDYFVPTGPGPVFVDEFTYISSNGIESSAPTTVTLFVGEITIPFEQPTLVPVLGVESESIDDTVTVDIFSMAGGSLTILNPTNITFDFGQNGDSDISISGTVKDLNKALDTLEYTPPSGFDGFDDLFFFFETGPGGGTQQPPPPLQAAGSQIVRLFVEPGPGGPGGPGGGGTVIAVDDEYYVDPEQTTFFASEAAGLISNDFSTQGGNLFAISETISSDLGGTVQINSDGSFSYTPPNFPQDEFIDVFTYLVSDEGETVLGFAILYVGDVPVPEDVNVLLPMLTVESLSPQSVVAVEVSSQLGASLTLFNTNGITFLAGNNGDSSFVISGLVKDVNFALDSLDYRPILDFSGDDTVTLEYDIPDGRGGMQTVLQEVPIEVQPFADPPILFVSPDPVEYLPATFAQVDIDTFLIDVDGSEILGLVILDFVPAGVIPSVGQQSSFNPQVFFILPSEIDNLSFFVDFTAPESFTIDVIATTIETVDEPGVFGGPGGPLLPTEPFEPRFGLSGQSLTFVRLPPPPVPPPPAEPPPITEFVFVLGPLSAPPAPPPKLNGPPKAKEIAKQFAAVIETESSGGFDDAGTTVIVIDSDPSSFNNDAATAEERDGEQGRRSYERSGIYVRKLGGDGPGQTARLPEQLAEDYSQFMSFLRTLPNGDYVVYFKRGGQSHEQASVRQTVVKVRVINHRLNPDPGEFKPAGEVAEPPENPGAGPATTEAPAGEERADVLIESPDFKAAVVPDDEWVPITASAWFAALATWKWNQERHEEHAGIDRLMERFSKTRKRLRRRPQKSRCGRQ